MTPHHDRTANGGEPQSSNSNIPFGAIDPTSEANELNTPRSPATGTDQSRIQTQNNDDAFGGAETSRSNSNPSLFRGLATMGVYSYATYMGIAQAVRPEVGTIGRVGGALFAAMCVVVGVLYVKEALDAKKSAN